MLNDLCDVAVKDAADLSKNNQEKFGQIRRDGLGASDSSVVLEVNPFPDNNEVELIRQKLSKVPTATEIKIGNMVNVKKGSDLEPLILEKFSDKFNVAVNKPKDMFMLKSMPFLRINYDGLINAPFAPEIPVEVKFISKYGAKYYTFEKCIGTLDEDKLPPKPHSSEHITKRYVKAMAKQTGIPIYYYTQVQQQLMGTGAELAYLSGLWDDDWELYTWVVYRDEKVIEAIKMKGYTLWQKISRLK